MITAYLAADGFEAELADELAAQGVATSQRYGRLFVTDAPPVPTAWAANTWFDVEALAVTSIGDAAKQLRDRQRNWAYYPLEHRGRAGLIAAKLPAVSAKPLALGAAAPTAPLGSWTLVEPSVLLCAARCSSPFLNGEPAFEEDRTGPPSRAYLKLWEAFVRLGRWPQAGERCLDLGASPGGWTWLLAERGAHVVAVDKAPLDPAVAALPTVHWRGESAFGLDPAGFGPVDWLCSDIVAYPNRLVALIERWLAVGQVLNVICTIKFQGRTDHAAVATLAGIPDAQVFHLHHNKHELTFARLSPRTR